MTFSVKDPFLISYAFTRASKPDSAFIQSKESASLLLVLRESLAEKQGYCVPEEVLAASLASCMNTIYLLTAGNSKLELKKLETKAAVKMNAEGLEN
jgi:organic hydroperoxide reductase OsmC/OhrA